MLKNMKSATRLQKQIQRTRQHLNMLEAKLHKIQYRTQIRETEEQRLRRLEAEFKREYPNMEIDRGILKLVGTLPARGSDRKLIADAIAEKYGK